MTPRNIYDKKHKTFSFTGTWKQIMGEPETSGIWIIFGNDKNGKTRFAILLAEYLSTFADLLYVSAEEGVDLNFKETFKWAKINHNKRGLHVVEYETIEELDERLKKRKAPKIVIIDNLTIYMDELKGKRLRVFTQAHPHTLFIFLAHEARKEPSGSAGIMAKKLAKIIVRVQGLAGQVSGRCPGGQYIIDEEKAALFHGQLTNSPTHQLTNSLSHE